jgi:hypothetical protein
MTGARSPSPAASHGGASLDAFVTELNALAAPSKRKILSLTEAAVSLEQDHAAEVAAAVERRVRTAEEGRPRMAAWYVLDSIVKRSPNAFAKPFGRRLAALACAHLTPWSTYAKLFESWRPIFSAGTLGRIERHLAPGVAGPFPAAAPPSPEAVDPPTPDPDHRIRTSPTLPPFSLKPAPTQPPREVPRPEEGTDDVVPTPKRPSKRHSSPSPTPGRREKKREKGDKEPKGGREGRKERGAKDTRSRSPRDRSREEPKAKRPKRSHRSGDKAQEGSPMPFLSDPMEATGGETSMLPVPARPPAPGFRDDAEFEVPMAAAAAATSAQGAVDSHAVHTGTDIPGAPFEVDYIDALDLSAPGTPPRSPPVSPSPPRPTSCGLPGAAPRPPPEAPGLPQVQAGHRAPACPHRRRGRG